MKFIRILATFIFFLFALFLLYYLFHIFKFFRYKNLAVKHRIVRSILRVILIICGIKLLIDGQERLKSGQLYIYAANHSSFFDHPVVFSSIKGYFNLTPVKMVFDFPIIGFIVKELKYIPVERTLDKKKTENMFEMIVRSVSNKSLLIYPEGKFSRDGKLLAFRRGTAEIAQRSGIPVVPIILKETFSILPIPPFKPVRKGLAFYRYALFWLGHSILGLKPKPVKVIIKEPLTYNSGETVEGFTERLRSQFTDLIEDGSK